MYLNLLAVLTQAPFKSPTQHEIPTVSVPSAHLAEGLLTQSHTFQTKGFCQEGKIGAGDVPILS